MSTFITALKGEYIKKKGTGLYWLAIAMGAFMPMIFALVQITEFEPGTENSDRLPYNYFTQYISEMLGGYSMFFFPLFIIIAVSRITQIDHRNGGWQLMETLPVTRWNIYGAKLAMVLTANLISIFSLITMSFIAGSFSLLFIETSKVASFSFEFLSVFKIILRLFVAGLFFTCLQYIISVIIPSFVWSILIGFFLLLGYIFSRAFNVIPAWYPLDILGHVGQFEKGSELGYPVTITEMGSIVLATATIYIGFHWYRYKGFKAAFLSNGKRTVLLFSVLSATLLFSYFIFTPSTTNRYTKTIVSGKIDSKQQFTTFVVTDKFIGDTVAIVPVKNNVFHYEIKKNIALSSYSFVMDGGLRGELYIGNKDSIYLNIKQNGKAIEANITGTRLAENSFNDKHNPNYHVSFSLLENNRIEDIDLFSNQLYKDWKNEIEETTKFRTVDNYIPGDDFLNQLKQIQTLTFLNYWQRFLNMRKVAYPGKPIIESDKIKEIKNMVPLNNSGLLASEEYFNYVRSLMIYKDETDTDENTKALKAIAKLAPGEFKDKMMVWQMRNSVREASSPEERETLVKDYAYSFSNKHFSENILALNTTLSHIEKGKQAPAIALTGLDGKPSSLVALKGKYLVVDVWATWCGPCKEESPFFEKLAIKYKGENIQFVAISIDRQTDKWFLEAKLKSKSILQLHANDDNQFSADYDIQGIPRFMLIDDKGNVVNANMPRPSDKTFEQTIRRELELNEL